MTIRRKVIPLEERVMSKDKQESTGKGMEQKKDTRIARGSNRTIKKELEVEKPDLKRAPGGAQVGRPKG
jgi:hypothetical protein